MKQQLIILSDLWGKEKSEWIKYYTQGLQNNFDITFYDCCELGDVDKTDYQESALHQQFVSGGIDRAVEKLIKLEQQKTHVLAFSVGGAIAWKYGLKSNTVLSLTCISSTRLRYEESKPTGQINLYFGEYDEFQPPQEWFEKMKLEHHVIPKGNHQVYSEKEFTRYLVAHLLNI